MSAAKQEQARRIFIQLVAPGASTEDTRRLTARTELKEEDGVWYAVEVPAYRHSFEIVTKVRPKYVYDRKKRS